jgi:uncharacterized membrane-anchored protein
MTTGMRKGLTIAAIHLAMVGSLGGKLLIDRATRPRVWARTAPIDPDLPIRGRYVRLRIEGVPAADLSEQPYSVPVVLSVQNETLMVARDPHPSGARVTARTVVRDGRQTAQLDPPLAFFIPEHVSDPSIRAAGEELWVEVTLPKQGPPRPLQLGVKKDGVLTPLVVE